MNVHRKLAGIGWIAVRELLHERVFYILICFAVLSVMLSALLGQLTYTDQQKLTLDFMLAGIEISMSLFSVFIGISLFKRELIMGSVAMVLSKPVSRTTFLVGKFLGQNLVQWVITLAMTGITLLLAAGSSRFNALAVIQAGVMICLELTILTAITYCLAVNASAITTAVGTGIFFCLGHLREAISLNFNPGSWMYDVWNYLRTIFPDFEVFNMKALASYGTSIRAPEFLWACTYALVCVVFFLFLASATFQRKDILT